MTHFRVTEAAALLGVSDDTVRRWIDADRLPAVRDPAGRWSVQGRDLAEFAAANATAPEVPGAAPSSTANRLVGLVTKVEREGLLAQVEIQAGPFRLVSVMTRERCDELSLAAGSLAVAALAAHDVVVEAPAVRR
jgi:excisionase family DNA binding protein